MRVADLRRLPLVNALERREGAGSQTTLTRDERRRNVRGAFAPTREAARARGRTVLLVDDVLTTGATVSEAADALSEAGVPEVVVLTFARVVPTRARDAA
jgi:predicted amidophosphoribosyltransferase